MPVNPFLIAGAAEGFGKLLFGGSQRAKANELKRFTEIPDSLKQNRADAQALARRSMYPGQTTDQAQLDRALANTQANTTRQARSATDILNSNAVAHTRANNAQADMSRRLQQWRTKGLNDLQVANNQIARVEEQNARDFWNTKAALQNASNTNIFGGVSDLLTAGGAMFSERAAEKERLKQQKAAGGEIPAVPPGATPPFNPYGNGFGGFNFGPYDDPYSMYKRNRGNGMFLDYMQPDFSLPYRK